MSKICIMGSGSWGTAQAVLLAKNHDDITLWGRIEDDILEIKNTRENRRFLPGILLPQQVKVTDDWQVGIQDAEIIILAVPAQAVREVITMLKPVINNNVLIVNTAKGIEIQSGMRMSEVIASILGQDVLERLGILSGPSHAEEVAHEIPTAVTIAAYNKNVAFLLQDVYMTNDFRVYTNPDVAGVELGGALKNIIALAAGIVHGLGYGDNTKAALMTRGLNEMTKMGEIMGGNFRTFAGLSGIGDLFVTCNSKLSRNWRTGEMLGQGRSLEDILNTIGMVVEGVYTTKIVNDLALKLGVDMPITKACFNILYNGASPRKELADMMQRQKKPEHEIEDIVGFISGW